MMGEWILKYDKNPPHSGWFPALRCWDVYEGVFPCGAYWNGREWSIENTTHWLEQLQPDEKTAESKAYENDPNW